MKKMIRVLAASTLVTFHGGMAEAALLHYWNLDQASGNFSNLVDGAQYSTPGPGIVRVSGVIGSGAISLTNHFSCYAVSALNTGFSVTDGITVEALVRWQPVAGWSATGGDYETIARKEEGSSRILFAFQPNGGGADTLALGLRIGGSYSELDMPLDGAAGRPSFAQATNGTHYIVGTYDKATGLRAIYWDGVLVYSNLHTAGSAIDTSGTSSPFTIGNNNNSGGEPFSGTIDEVAVWSHALSAGEIGYRYTNSQGGLIYFDLPAPSASAATSVATNGFTANWGTVPYATNYQLDVSRNALFTHYLPGYSNRAVGLVTSLAVTNVSAGGVYYYRLRTQGPLFTSTNSAVITVTAPYTAQYPRHFWNFDDARGNFPDVEDFSHAATKGSGLSAVAGLAGAGAIAITNINTGWASAGTTGYEVTNGIAVASIVRWSPAAGWSSSGGDFETIVRKEEGGTRILLAFQPNGGSPDTLAWGINVEGSYSELDMPLDGLDGRPTFNDATNGTHHVVATYDVASGLRAIFWDGVMVYWSNHTAGAVLDTSGSGNQFTIGNSGPNSAEPFNGTLDEIAFFDTALSAAEVQRMYANVQAGYSHFDAVWDGGGADNRWSTEGNWLTVGPPTNRFAVFTGTTRLDTTNDLPAGTRINGLQFRSGAGAFSISGAEIYLRGEVVNESSYAQSIGANLHIDLTRQFRALNGDLFVSGVITGAGSLTKEGPYTLNLAETNSYTGVTLINSGAVSVARLANVNTDSSIGRGSVGGSSADLVLAGGTLRYTGSVEQSSTRLFSVDTAGGTMDGSGVGTGTVNFSATGAMGFNSQSGARTLTLAGSNTGSNTLSLVIGDSGGATTVRKTGSGLWVLAGVNTFSGETVVSGGVLVARGGQAIPDASVVRLANADGATLRLDADETIAGLAGGGAAGGQADLSGKVLTLLTTADQTFAGALVGSGTVVKRGSAQQSLTGTNSLTGLAVISNGTLAVDGRLTNASVEVRAEGTLAGAGWVGAVSSVGVVSPGGGGVATLRAASLNLSGGAYTWNITNASGGAGVGWDLLSTTNAAGAIDLSGAGAASITIRVSSAVSPLPNFSHTTSSWLIAESASVVGFSPAKFVVTDSAFAAGSEGGTWAVSNQAGLLYLSYTPGAPLDLGVSISATPNPVDVGSTITYSITVTNLSVYTAGTYVITNQLAPGMVYLGSSDGGTQSGGFVRWVLTNLASHTARTVTMTAEPALQGSVIVVAAVRPYRADENELNNTATNTILAVCPFAGTVTNNAPLAHVGTNGIALSFSVIATNADCSPPFLRAGGLPVGATFTTVTNGYGLTGTFLWPSPTLGTHPVRFYSYNETKSTSTVVTVIHIGGIGEPQTDGVPNSRTNWSIAITNLIASSANATVVWVSVAGVSYDLYTSSQPLGGGASWGTPAITGLEAVANLSTAALPTAASGGMRFYQVVPQGQARTDRGVWGVVRPTIPSALFMMAPPLVGDRSFADDGALGRAFTSAVPVGSRIHFATNATPDWMTLELMAGGVWRTDPGIAEYATPLNPGQAFFIEGASATTPNFSGPVGNVNTQTLSLTVGANLVGLSEGKSLAASTAFSAASMNPDPVGNYNEDAADQLVIQHSDGSWRRLIRQPGGTWYDMETRTTTTVALNPGEAAYYIRRSNSSSVAF